MLARGTPRRLSDTDGTDELTGKSTFEASLGVRKYEDESESRCEGPAEMSKAICGWRFKLDLNMFVDLQGSLNENKKKS